MGVIYFTAYPWANVSGISMSIVWVVWLGIGLVGIAAGLQLDAMWENYKKVHNKKYDSPIEEDERYSKEETASSSIPSN